MSKNSKPSTGRRSGGPIVDVHTLKTVTDAVAIKIKQARGMPSAPAAARAMPAPTLTEAAIKPGVGQMGVSQSNGIELHPVLKIEWL
jgi:hypothetical protein